jgi:CRP-like cAMP-binding protein
VYGSGHVTPPVSIRFGLVAGSSSIEILTTSRPFHEKGGRPAIAVPRCTTRTLPQYSSNDHLGIASIHSQSANSDQIEGQQLHLREPNCSSFDEQPHCATVSAVSETELAVIEGRLFLEFLDEHREIGYSIVKSILCQLVPRLRKTDHSVFSLLAWGLKTHEIDRI